MKSVVVLGAGKVGKSVAELLLACGKGQYRVLLCDRDRENLAEAEQNLARLRAGVPFPTDFATRLVDASDGTSVRAALGAAGPDGSVVCMLPFNYVAGIAEAANELGVHYFDVTEDVETTEQVRAIDSQGRAKVALVPQCGLAPGYIAIAAHELASRFDTIDELTLRVGALPRFPTNRLKYNITWSTAGVVNEYCEPCNVMLDGKIVKVPALEGLENFSFEGVEYEAFYTSGGVGSLIDTLIAEGKVTPNSRIAYKTIRYPGHCELMKFLLQDLRLGVEGARVPNRSGSGADRFNRNLAVELLDHAIARTLQDVVVIFINAIGTRQGRREQINFRRIVPATDLFGRTWPAIELTTAAGVCAMVDLHRLGKLPRSGFVSQEQCGLGLFNQSIFGLAYENPSAIEQAVRG